MDHTVFEMGHREKVAPENGKPIEEIWNHLEEIRPKLKPGLYFFHRDQRGMIFLACEKSKVAKDVVFGFEETRFSPDPADLSAAYIHDLLKYLNMNKDKILQLNERGGETL